jgi:inosine/xanthosine triphosphate pyrophosphatase family protein
MEYYSIFILTVKKSKADSMTKKEKESASRRKRDTERKSSGSKINMVKTDT